MSAEVMPPIRAVLLAHARSGSTLLMEFLDAQPETSFAHELFHQRRARLPAFAGAGPVDQAELKARRDADPLGFLAGLSAACPTRIFGFKWFRGHTPAVRHALIADPAWRVLILYRDNYLALHASQLTAQLTGQYALRPGKAAAEPPSLPFDAEAFRTGYAAYRRYYDGLLRECDREGKPFVLIEYRQLSRPEFLRNAARHIGVAKPLTPPPRMVKQGSPDLAARFSDPGLVRRTVDSLGQGHWMTEAEDVFAVARPGP
jgi:LPS sulfotransferase NodH